MKLLSFLLFVPIAIAGPVEMPWKQELSNTSSGYTDQEAAGKVRYYLRKDLKTWEDLCEVGQGKFRYEFGKTVCDEYYPECWECTGTATAYCDI
ncbi:MAG: hypothetical protein EB078_06245 [Proteobacteria bacterium]|nr:hypothetical protein [Pseudomonadota bacterium]NDD04486.1 hypothetical protein [Pseudomonadota bacterium]NDG27923.1 hypothetical protein [Pseudomonadota bacterium]